MGPGAPRTYFCLSQETTRAGGGQNGECSQAPHELRQFAIQIGVFADQDPEHDQYGTEPESDGSRGPQNDTDQNRERTHILGLIYTWLAARASLALRIGIGERSL